MNILIAQRQRRKKRVRSKAFGTRERPRFSVFRSNRYVYAQLIDDVKGQVLVSASEKQLEKKSSPLNKSQKATMVGMLLSKSAKSKRITSVVFDKGRYAFAGRIKALADGPKEGGLVF